MRSRLPRVAAAARTIGVLAVAVAAAGAADAAQGYSLLSIAAHNGDLPAVRAFFSRETTAAAGTAEGLEARDTTGRTPLHAAAARGHAAVVAELLRRRASALARDRASLSPLHIAAKWGHAEIVEVLLTAHSDNWGGNATTFANGAHNDRLQRTALQLAVVAGHSGVVARLLSARRGDGVCERSMESIAAAVAGVSDLEARDRSGSTALHSAVAIGHASIVQQLLEARAQADSSTRDREGRTAVHVAAASCNEAVLSMLTVDGETLQDVNSLDRRGRTPLHYAARARCVEVVKTLLRDGADDSIPDYQGITPYNEASAGEHAQVIALMPSHEVVKTASPGTGNELFKAIVGRFFASNPGFMQSITINSR